MIGNAITKSLSAALLMTYFLPSATPGQSARSAQTWPQIFLVQVATGFTSPVQVTNSRDGSGRLFVIEQPGKIWILKEHQRLERPFLDITGLVRSPDSGGGSEEGLLSLAFPPGFGSARQHFYVYYTRPDGNNQLSRFSVSNDPQQADPLSEEQILTLAHPTFSNHNGGQLVFGPQDSFLYLSTGDGGGAGDPSDNAQDPASLLGKLLRIDVEAGTDPYAIPSGNPFVGNPAYRGEIWALGLRNPWRFSFDRQTWGLYIGEVGQGSWEEIDYQPSGSMGGENYGWNIMEGEACYPAEPCDSSGLILPVLTYPTHVGGACAVTGGFVYRGTLHLELIGTYLFADYCNGLIQGLRLDGSTWESQGLLDTPLAISSFGEDETGELYVVDHNGGIYALRSTSIAQPIFLPAIHR